jgi:hypothetical protein
MKKPFNIHDWQAKQTIKRLTEQKDIDNIMRMNPDANRDSLDNLYQPDLSVYGKKDKDDLYYIDQIKRDLEELDDKEAIKYLNDLIKAIVALRDSITNEDDLEEASMTGTGASFTAGSGAGYMTPNAFKKKKKN